MSAIPRYIKTDDEIRTKYAAMTNRIITPTKLAKRWGVTPRTIHRMIKAGDLPDRKVVHKKEIWFESDIEEFEQNPETKEGMELVK